MSHDHSHHHADMVANTNTAMNHDHHTIQEQTNTNSVLGEHGSHTKDMMMMGVSIQFTLIMAI